MSLIFNSWNACSHESFHLNLTSFLVNRTGELQGEVLGLTKPLSHNSCNWTLSSGNSVGAILCGVIEMGIVPGCNSIQKSISLYGGNPDNSSEKTFSYSQTTRGRSKSFLASSSKVRLASHHINYPFHLESYTARGEASCLSPLNVTRIPFYV